MKRQLDRGECMHLQASARGLGRLDPVAKRVPTDDLGLHVKVACDPNE